METHVSGYDSQSGNFTDPAYGIAREILHKQNGGVGAPGHGTDLKEEWTSWTGVTTPPAVTKIRSFSFP